MSANEGSDGDRNHRSQLLIGKVMRRLEIENYREECLAQDPTFLNPFFTQLIHGRKEEYNRAY